MSAKNKIKNVAQDLTGKAKQAAGEASGDRDTELEGRGDQVKADLKNAGEQAKDAAGQVKESFDR